MTGSAIAQPPCALTSCKNSFASCSLRVIARVLFFNLGMYMSLYLEPVKLITQSSDPTYHNYCRRLDVGFLCELCNSAKRTLDNSLFIRCATCDNCSLYALFQSSSYQIM